MSLEDIARAFNSEVGRMAQLAFAGLVGAWTDIIFRPVDAKVEWRSKVFAAFTGMGFAYYIVPALFFYLTRLHIPDVDKQTFQLACAASYGLGMLARSVIPVLINVAPKVVASAILRVFNRGGAA